MPSSPTLVSYSEVASWGTTGGTKTVTIPSFNSGDLIVIIGGNEGLSGESLSTPTATGLVFSDIVNHTALGSCSALLSSATAASGGSNVVVSITNSNTSEFGFGVWVWRNAALGNNASGFTAAFTVSITPAGGADSAFVWGTFDFVRNPAQTIVPTPTNTRQRVQLTDWTVYVADLADQVSAGAISYGISGTGSGPFAKVALEIKFVVAPVASTSMFDLVPGSNVMWRDC